MKKRYLNIVVFALFVSMLLGCSDWTKPEAEDFFEMPGNDYYENLRAYKRSEHSVAFGWFGGWTGVGASMVGSLMGLPDSVTSFPSGETGRIWMKPGCWIRKK